MTLRIGLIGLGAIGSAVCRILQSDSTDRIAIVGALVRDHSRRRSSGSPLILNDLDELLARKPSVVVECAGHAALRQYGGRILSAGCDLLTVSVGALADDALLRSLRDAAVKSGSKLRIPSGAVAGLDGIAAAALGQLTFVVHTVRKPARTLLGSQALGMTESAELYRGPSGRGVEQFPESANVVAAVSLAGIGFQRTEMRVVADPTATRNEHVIEAEGEFGSLRIVVQGIPTAENPRTGRLTPMSVVRTLRNLATDVVIA